MRFFSSLLLGAASWLALFTNVGALTNCGSVTISSSADTSNVTNCISFESLTVTGSDITSLSFMSSVRNIEGKFIIRDTSITNLDGLGSLDRIQDDFIIDSNPELITMYGIANLSSILGSFTVSNNAKVQTLRGFDKILVLGVLATNKGGDLTIVNNTGLFSLEGLLLLAEIRGTVTIGGCPSLTSLNGLLVTQRWKIGSLNLFNLTSLSDVSALSNLVNFGGSLSISNVPGLLSLWQDSENLGLLNSEYSVNTISIVGTGLTSLTGLSGFKNVSNLIIKDNAALTDTSALATIETIATLDFNGNPKISDPRLIRLKTISGDFALRNMPSFSSFSSFSNLLSIGGALILENLGVSDLGSWPSLTSVAGDISLLTLPVTNLTPLASVTGTWGKTLEVSNLQLASLSTVASLYSVNGRNPSTIGGIIIDSMPKLKDFSGLEFINTISDLLQISSNPILSDVSQLGNLSYVGGDMFVFDNPLLCNFNTPNLTLLLQSGKTLVMDLNYDGCGLPWGCANNCPTFGPWGNWSSCPTECDLWKNATQSRNRTCTDPSNSIGVCLHLSTNYTRQKRNCSDGDDCPYDNGGSTINEGLPFWIWIVIAIGAAILIAGVVTIAVVMTKKRRNQKEKEEKDVEKDQSAVANEASAASEKKSKAKKPETDEEEKRIQELKMLAATAVKKPVSEIPPSPMVDSDVSNDIPLTTITTEKSLSAEKSQVVVTTQKKKDDTVQTGTTDTLEKPRKTKKKVAKKIADAPPKYDDVPKASTNEEKSTSATTSDDTPKASRKTKRVEAESSKTTEVQAPPGYVDVPKSSTNDEISTSAAPSDDIPKTSRKTKRVEAESSKTSEEKPVDAKPIQKVERPRKSRVPVEGLNGNTTTRSHEINVTSEKRVSKAKSATETTEAKETAVQESKTSNQPKKQEATESKSEINLEDDDDLDTPLGGL